MITSRLRERFPALPALLPAANGGLARVATLAAAAALFRGAPAARAQQAPAEAAAPSTATGRSRMLPGTPNRSVSILGWSGD